MCEVPAPLSLRFCSRKRGAGSVRWFGSCSHIVQSRPLPVPSGRVMQAHHRGLDTGRLSSGSSGAQLPLQVPSAEAKSPRNETAVPERPPVAAGGWGVGGAQEQRWQLGMGGGGEGGQLGRGGWERGRGHVSKTSG